MRTEKPPELSRAKGGKKGKKKNLCRVIVGDGREQVALFVNGKKKQELQENKKEE